MYFNLTFNIFMNVNILTYFIHLIFLRNVIFCVIFLRLFLTLIKYLIECTYLPDIGNDIYIMSQNFANIISARITFIDEGLDRTYSRRGIINY